MTNIFADLKSYIDGGKLAFNVKEFGAVGDGVNDDAASIQAAINAALQTNGVVWFPAGNYNVGTTLLLGDGNQNGVSLAGAGAYGTVLRWVGPIDGTLLKVDRATFYRISGLNFLNVMSKGTTQGIWVKAAIGTGTRSNGAVYENVLIDGFGTGFRGGDHSVSQACSEYLFVGLQVQNCDVGISLEDSNTLDFVFHMLGIASNGIGLTNKMGAGSVHVYGGSASGQTTTDFYTTGGVNFAVENFRSETANRFLQAGCGGPSTILVKSCWLSQSSNADDVVIDVANNFFLTVASSVVLGKILATPGGNFAGSISIFSSAIADDLPCKNKVAYNSFQGVTYSWIGCWQIDLGNNYVGPFADEVGIGTASGRVASWTASNGNLLVGTTNTPTNATDGFLRLPTCEGTPTGVPSSGDGSMIVDRTHHKMYVYLDNEWSWIQ
jgi:hypothetical protein